MICGRNKKNHIIRGALITNKTKKPFTNLTTSLVDKNVNTLNTAIKYVQRKL